MKIWDVLRQINPESVIWLFSTVAALIEIVLKALQERQQPPTNGQE